MVSWFLSKTQKGRFKGRLEGRPFLGVKKRSLHRSAQNLGAMLCARPTFWVQGQGARPMFGCKHEVWVTQGRTCWVLWVIFGNGMSQVCPVVPGTRFSSAQSWVLRILIYFGKTPATREPGKQGASCASNRMHQWPRTPTQSVHPKISHNATQSF